MTTWRKYIFGILPLLIAFPAFARHREPSYDPAGNASPVSVEKSGTIPTKPGLGLRLNHDEVAKYTRGERLFE